MRPASCILTALQGLLAVNEARAGTWYTNLTVKYVYGGSIGGRAAVGVTTAVPYGTCPNTNEFKTSRIHPSL